VDKLGIGGRISSVSRTTIPLYTRAPRSDINRTPTTQRSQYGALKPRYKVLSAAISPRFLWYRKCLKQSPPFEGYFRFDWQRQISPRNTGAFVERVSAWFWLPNKIAANHTVKNHRAHFIEFCSRCDLIKLVSSAYVCRWYRFPKIRLWSLWAGSTHIEETYLFHRIRAKELQQCCRIPWLRQLKTRFIFWLVEITKFTTPFLECSARVQFRTDPTCKVISYWFHVNRADTLLKSRYLLKLGNSGIEARSGITSCAAFTVIEGTSLGDPILSTFTPLSPSRSSAMLTYVSSLYFRDSTQS